MRTLCWLICSAVLMFPAVGFGEERPVTSEQVATWIAELGNEDYTRREAATRNLIRSGGGFADQLQAEMIASNDPEIRHRIQYVLSNITPPQFAALVISAAPETGIRPGDVVTHVNGRPVRGSLDLLQRLDASSFGMMLRIRRADGTQELGPFESRQLYHVSNYVAPRGARYAQLLRLFDAGDAPGALTILQQIQASGSIRDDELPTALQACLLFTAGQAKLATDLLRGFEELALPVYSSQVWESPSHLDRLLGRKAPFQLEWEMFVAGGETFQRHEADHDLRMQRILEPAGRYLETCVRALQIWREDLRDNVDRSHKHIAGNMLAVAGWMLFELDLRAECCQLIEPRSILLRSSNRNPQKWVRVDTDAWLPFLGGDTQAAVDEFYEYALAVLVDPPNPNDIEYVIQNPTVAARIAFFLYQLPEDKRVDELAAHVIREKHPILPAYLDWMLLSLNFNNQKIIRRDLQQSLPLLTDEAATQTARDVALLEYLQETPRREVFLSAEDRLRQAPGGPEQEAWVAIAQALERLVAGAPAEAEQLLRPVADDPLATALYHTSRFRAEPPAAAELQDLLRDPLLAIPLTDKDATWLLLTRNRRLMRFDVASEALEPIEEPVEGWFPNPRCWPWIGSNPEDGRGWVYGRRRLVEIKADGTLGMRLNIERGQVATIETVLGPALEELVELLKAQPMTAEARSGEFLPEQVLAHHGLVSDPGLPELAIARPLPRDPRVAQFVVRGGQQLLLWPDAGRAYASHWLAEKLGVASLRFFTRAQDPGDGGAAPLLWLFSNHGLLRFDLETEQLVRIDLPGDAPHAAVIPESVPYERNEPDALYCARMPDDGGHVYRIRLSDLQVEALDLVNLALPREYFLTLTRAEIRETIDQRLVRANLPPLNEIIVDADQVIRSLEPRTE